MARQSKPDSGDVYSTLVRLGSEGTVYLAPRASEAAICHMQATAAVQLGEPVPDSYERLLRIANGVQIQGAFFKEAENVVPENLDINHPEIIVLGNDGNMAYYVFDKRDSRFHTINVGFPDERFDSYDTFEEMLAGVLREQGIHDP